MNKHITEELPARKFAASQKPPSPVKSNSKTSSDINGNGKIESFEKKVRQAVYDIRYRARREDVPLTTAFSQYLQNSGLGAKERLLVKQKLFGKAGMQEDFNIRDVASESVATAMFKVFVEGISSSEGEIDAAQDYIEELNSLPEKKYKVRVTDKNSKKSYVRYATREKIAQLRANPNIESVELTEYGEPYEGEKKRGERTAAVKSGKDWDGDGKVESGAKEYRGVVHNAIQRRKGAAADGRDTSNVKENFIREVNSENGRPKKFDVKGKNDKPNNVVLMPKESSFKEEKTAINEISSSKSQQRFMGMVLAAKKGETPASPEVAKAAEGMSKKSAKDFAKTKHEGLPEKVKESACDSKMNVKKRDTRGDDTKINMIQNKFRAMGIKNPIVMAASYEPEGENIDEIAGALVKGALAVGGLYAASKAGEALKKKADAKIDGARRDWKIGGDRRVPQNNSYELEGSTISEREFDEPGEEDWRPDVRAHNKAVGYRGGYKPNKRGPKPGTSGPGSQAKPAD
jgi:hypothetical protein